MIDVQNLSYQYPKVQFPTLQSMNFSIARGEILGFLGPSGAGKTTTQKILIGLLNHYSGQVLINGKERREWNRDFYENIGVAFDFPNLYVKLTARENLTLIASYYQKNPKDINKLLDRVGLLPYADDKVESYSKGMKMRLNFIRPFVHDPDIFFFDEPTSGLDPVNGKIIKEMIEEQKNLGKTIFLTTHNMNVADELCDRVAFIVDGKLPEIGKPKDLKVRYGKRIMKIEYYEGSQTVTEVFSMNNLKTNPRPREILEMKEIKTIHSQEATLEEVFIKVTGRGLK